MIVFAGAFWSEREEVIRDCGVSAPASSRLTDDEEIYYSGLETQPPPPPQKPQSPRGGQQQAETPSPSEMSSGMLMCEYAQDHRRAKTWRRTKYQGKTTAASRGGFSFAQPSASQAGRPRSRPRQAGVGGGGSSSEETSSWDEKRRLPQTGKLGVRNHRPPHSSQSQLRCHACAQRLSLPSGTFQCRCGKAFCARHRLPDLHTCTAEQTATNPAAAPAPPPKPPRQFLPPKFAEVSD